MTMKYLGPAIAIVIGGTAFAAPAQAQNEQFIPALVYRTGAYAPNGVPFANGIADYYTLLNERDGGINGVKIVWEECEFGYATDRGVECYERLKKKGPTGAAYVNPFSTGVTFALTEKAPIDKIPLISMGYGRSESREGAVFQWNFSFSTSPRRKAVSTSSRARRSRWSITTARMARSRSRC
jgi:branched-chain amino acid transport system substrate-binding protein